MIRALLLSLLLLPISLAPTNASDFAISRLAQFQSGIIKQQSFNECVRIPISECVINPTSNPMHVWDVDDEVRINGYGSVEPGQTVSHQDYIIADYMYHVSGIMVSVEKNARWQAKIRLSTGHEAIVSERIVDGGMVSGRACVVGPVYGRLADGTMPGTVAIEGSQGGFGNYITVTWEFTNLGPRRVNKLSIYAEMNATQTFRVQRWCPGASNVSDLLWTYNPAVGISQ